MDESSPKVIHIVGCCGLDCGLCPRFYTEGTSKCDGCGSEYSYAAVGCTIYRCCVQANELETCAQCTEFPCSRITDAWDDEYDSFLTHRKMRANLTSIKDNGITGHVHTLETRMKLLRELLDAFNDGRSKSYYCLAATLLSITDLETSLMKAKQRFKTECIQVDDRKTRTKILKEFLNSHAENEGLELKLRKKRKKKNK
jgi:hypothetical protein